MTEHSSTGLSSLAQVVTGSGQTLPPDRTAGSV